MVERLALLKRRFCRALPSYEEEARVQRLLSERLLSAILSEGRAFPRVLELGCGTGLFTRRAKEALLTELYVACDLLFECGKWVSPLGVRFLCADAERPPFGEGTFDLVVGSAVAQWFQNPKEALFHLSALLKPKGLLALSTFGPETMRELPRREIPAGLLSLEAWLKLSPPGLSVIRAEKHLERIPFPDGLSVLRHLKKTGAAGYLRGSGVSCLKAWLRENPGPLELTFEMGVILWRKEG